MMDADIVEKVSRQVFAKYPEVANTRPSVQTVGAGGNSLLIYKGSGKTANGITIQRVVRVVVSETGKIIRMSSSK
jgi:hypothetical protein